MQQLLSRDLQRQHFALMHLLSKPCCYPLPLRPTPSNPTLASTLPVLKPLFPVLLNNSQSPGVCCKVATSPEGFEVDVPTARSVPKVLIAGGGIGGLVVALGLLKRGFDVQVFERDLTAIRGEGKYRGPIQIQSNALAALEAIDSEMAEEVFSKGVVTGDRVNGLCDGFTGEWYVKFDTFSPAADAGLPVTRVINRVTLQEILCRHVQKWSSRGPDVILEGSHVISYQQSPPESSTQRVTIQLEDGREFSGDLLIGADGIWSKIRKQLFGVSPPNYSEYTCYTGIADFTPADIDTVGYRVFLGNGKYFVSSDVGAGKMQWYGFHKEPQGGTDPIGQRKRRLFEIFGTWCEEVVDLIEATPEEDVLRRDIFDKAPIFRWHKDRVIVLGDAAHAMQPNLGQGGCMAIEDAFQLSLELGDAFESCQGDFRTLDYSLSLRRTVRRRVWRAAIIHWLAAMAAISATTYKTYLGEGLGVLSFITRYRIPHFGKVAGQVILKIFMPVVLGWVLGGNLNTLKRGSYTPYCRLGDRPQAYGLEEFREFINNDRKLKQAALADWWLIPSHQNHYEDGIQISTQEVLIGRHPSSDVHLTHPEDSEFQAKISVKKLTAFEEKNCFFIESLTDDDAILVNGVILSKGHEVELVPGDVLKFGKEERSFKIKLRHISCRPKGSIEEKEKSAVEA